MAAAYSAPPDVSGGPLPNEETDGVGPNDPNATRTEDGHNEVLLRKPKPNIKSRKGRTLDPP